MGTGVWGQEVVFWGGEEGTGRRRDGRGGRDGERTWAHFRDLGRIWDGEKETGGGEGDKGTGGGAHFGAFSRFLAHLGRRVGGLDGDKGDNSKIV